MKGLIKQLKYRFYRQSITKMIILVITMLSILSNAVFVGECICNHEEPAVQQDKAGS